MTITHCSLSVKEKVESDQRPQLFYVPWWFLGRINRSTSCEYFLLMTHSRWLIYRTCSLSSSAQLTKGKRTPLLWRECQVRFGHRTKITPTRRLSCALLYFSPLSLMTEASSLNKETASSKHRKGGSGIELGVFSWMTIQLQVFLPSQSGAGCDRVEGRRSEVNTQLPLSSMEPGASRAADQTGTGPFLSTPRIPPL